MFPDAPGRPVARATALAALLALLTLAALALGTPAPAGAGQVHPDVEERLAALPPGNPLSVIVELADQADPHAAGRAHRVRRARLRAVVDALRDKAARTQGPIRALLARELAAGRVQRAVPLWIVNGVAVTAPEGVIRALAARPDVREVRLDRTIPLPTPVATTAGPGSAPSEWNIDQVRAPEVWAIDPSYTGVGTVVGSFDTGVDGSHPDLAPRYRGNDAISWFDPYGEHASPFDADGHGTHTTGTMVGGDAGGTQIGVAPGARWIAAKGWSDAGLAFVSAFHQIFEWFLAPGGDPANAPDVVNMSWSFLEAGCLPDFQPDVQAMRAAGILPVFAAGNNGPFPGTVRSPGTYPESFSIGATDPFDDVAWFSSRGPSPCDGSVKPDLSAPGDGILSTVPGGYASFSGTSMAAPHVAGAVAVLLSIDPGLGVDEVEALLIQGAIDLGAAGPDNAFGAGRLDLFQSAQIALGGGGPDQPRVTITATTPTATEAGLAAGLFTVSRTGPTDAALTVLYAVSGSATAGSDYVALPGTVTIPAGAATATIAVTPLDDTLVETDETVVVSIRPDPAYFAANPSRATVTIQSDEIPSDLVVSALTVPASASAGDAVTVTDTVRNQGGGPAEASTLRFYLSTDATLDAADAGLGSRAVPTLAVGASHNGSTSVTIPAGTTPGLWYVLAVADGDQAVVESDETNNLAARSIQIGPDLVVSALSAPASAGAGQAIAVTDTTRNQGAGPAAASTTRFYLSTNPTWDAADTALGSRAVPALAPGAASEGSTTLTIPAGTAGGLHYLIARADGDGAVPEASETNNTASALVQIGPDLWVSALTVPAGAGAGQAIAVTDTTANRGGGPAGASITRFYLSADLYWQATDTPIGSRAVPALAAGAGSTASTTVTIPAGTAPGPWYVIARADADQAVSEADEANNVTARPVTVGADLVIAALSAPSAAGAGATITVTDTTRNQGAGDAGASTTRLYLSADGLLDASDPLLGSRAVPALAAGASSSGSTTVTIPAGTVAGSYYLFARADDDGVVAETSETNNRGFAVVQVGADLVVSSLTAPGTAGAGASITITDTTRNQAGGQAVASVTRFYLSTDVVWDGGDVSLGHRSVPALAGGASHSASTVVTLPAGTAAGTYYVLARADADGAVSETVETNNVTPATVLIGPDLAVTALSAPTSAGPGATITVSDTTRNQGAGAAGASTTRIYLSADTLLDGGDSLLGGRAVPALGAGVSHAGSTVVTLPGSLGTGTWYLIARADADGVVGETIETNNLATTTVQVGGDLVVSALTVPATAGAGAAVTVTDTTRNQGAGGVGASTTRFYLSTDATLDGADLALGGRAVPALGASASHAASTVVTIPAGIAGGAYFVIARADADDAVPETIETNNTTARSIQIGADLVVSPVTAPATGGAGAAVTVTDTTRNQGGAAAGASTTAIYLSTNAVLDAGDVWLGSRAVPALGVGATHTGSTAVTLPAGTAPGAWYLIALADADGIVAETSEANNTGYAVIQVGPDLAVTTLSVPTSAGAGVTITVTDTTRNQGGGGAGASTTGFYLSTDPLLGAGDVWLGSRAVPALGASASSTASTALTIPAGTASGTYYLIARADAADGVVESQEGNNTAFAAIALGTDLVVAWVTGPGVAGAGAPVTINDATKNQGGGAVGPTVTAFYLSTNTALDAADVFLGSRPVPGLAAGATSTASTAVTMPAGTAPGTYYVIARADADGVEAEGQEGNNTNYTGLVVGPDLMMLTPQAPASAAAGTAITVTDTTRNAGGGAAGASTTGFYLSANAVLDGGDPWLGSRAVPALAGGVNSTGSTVVTLPAGLAPGTYYLFARADDGGAVTETNESNNAIYRTIQITP
jgi:subtilase family serine protease/subtilisin family serine protease